MRLSLWPRENQPMLPARSAPPPGPQSRRPPVFQRAKLIPFIYPFLHNHELPFRTICSSKIDDLVKSHQPKRWLQLWGGAKLRVQYRARAARPYHARRARNKKSRGGSGTALRVRRNDEVEAQSRSERDRWTFYETIKIDFPSYPNGNQLLPAWAQFGAVGSGRFIHAR